MEHLIEPLKNLGLSEKEAKVYLALLQLGPATPYQVAKKAGLKRPTAYVIAEELCAKGLLIHVPGEEKRRYIARTPDAFIEEREVKIQAVKKILPELRSFQKGTAEKTSILYFDGVEGLRQAYQYKQRELHGQEIVGFFGNPDLVSPDIDKVAFAFNEYRQRHNIRMRVVGSDVPGLNRYARYLKTMTSKMLPPDVYNSPASIESCGSFVRIILFDSTQALIIDSSHTARAIEQIFELVWASLEGKYDTPSLQITGE